MRKEKRHSTELNDQSPQNRRGHSPHAILGRSKGLMRGQSDNLEVGGNLSPESKRFLKAMMTSGHPERDPLPLREPPQVFGPALPPKLPGHSSRRRKMTSHRSSPSSQESSSSSSSFSSSSSCSEERKKSKEKGSRRREDRRKSSKDKKQRRSRSRDKSTQQKRDSAKASGSSNLKSGTTLKSEKNSASQKRPTFTDVNRKRNRQDPSLNGSPDSKKRKVSPALEKSRKRVQERNKDSERRYSHGSSYGKKDMASVKRNSNAHEYSSKTALTNYSTSSSSSSSSRSDREHGSPEARQKLDAKQSIKESSTDKAAASGETLKDLELFLQDLKAKKKAMSK